MPGFDEVCEQMPPENTLEDAVMDNGYDSNQIRTKLKDKSITPVIPPKSNRKETITYEKDKYRLREKIERFFSRLKQYRHMRHAMRSLGISFSRLSILSHHAS